MDSFEHSEHSESEQLPVRVIRMALKVPGVRINRRAFLEKELRNRFPQEVVMSAIDNNPAFAGIRRCEIDRIAKSCINYETTKVSGASFVAGLPGGFAMFGTVPADIAQFYAFMLRIMQKLAYLYSFEEFEQNENDVSDDTLHLILVFLGVMLGVQGAESAITRIAGSCASNTARTLARRTLTRTTIYPIVRRICRALGIRMTKETFAKGVSKIIPVAGGVLCGGLTCVSFKIYSNRLQRQFMQLPQINPEFYTH